MVSVRPPTEGDFALELEKVLQENREAGQAFVVITAGELHRRVGGYPGPNHRMPTCCAVMRTRLRSGDDVLEAPPSGHGASLKIRYQTRE